MPDRQPPVPVLIMSEHASCAVPDEWADRLAGQGALLPSYRDLDSGTLVWSRCARRTG